MQSDLFIPRLCDILDRACELLGSAYRLQDDRTAGQLERLIQNLPGATLCWQLGTLHLTSPSGHTYRVTRGGCSCPNGVRSHARACWHVACYETLIDMFSTECDTADMLADEDAWDSGFGSDGGIGYDATQPPCARSLGQRLAAARAVFSLEIR